MLSDDTPHMQVQQVSNIPEPVATMPKVDPAFFKNMDELINGILDAIGEKGSALAMAAAVKATDLVANGVDRVAGAASAAYNPNFIAAGTPSVGLGNTQDGPSQGRGRDVTDSQSMGSQRSESIAMAEQGVHVPDGTLVQPNVSFGKGPSQNQGVAI